MTNLEYKRSKLVGQSRSRTGPQIASRDRHRRTKLLSLIPIRFLGLGLGKTDEGFAVNVDVISRHS